MGSVDFIEALVVRKVGFPNDYLDGISVVRYGLQFRPESDEPVSVLLADRRL
ncbi:hypothetical protein [Halorussus salinisoli]|uniref:hypothetical protein n=1 Tax=Halorussus salinisoli TaxID=2558242 RepID=UPI001484DA50|nr:hypothetical protein [Halorussus salinisoli]